jgi:hypothetical protein
MVDPQIAEICRRAKISDYLRARGVDIVQTRRGFKCKCPLPGHKDDTPSFSVRTMPDGAEVYKCFGCGRSGGIITLMHEIENVAKGSIVRRLSATHNVELGSYHRAIETRDHLKDNVLAVFCEEDQYCMDIAEIAMAFMRGQDGSEDSVNKISRVYKELDRMIEEGDVDGARRIEYTLRNIMSQ